MIFIGVWWIYRNLATSACVFKWIKQVGIQFDEIVKGNRYSAGHREGGSVRQDKGNVSSDTEQVCNLLPAMRNKAEGSSTGHGHHLTSVMYSLPYTKWLHLFIQKKKLTPMTGVTFIFPLFRGLCHAPGRLPTDAGNHRKSKGQLPGRGRGPPSSSSDKETVTHTHRPYRDVTHYNIITTHSLLLFQF